MSYISPSLRRQVRQRARNRCEYCLIHQDDMIPAHEVDHIYAEKHGGGTVAVNMCLSCYHCNRFKGTDLASLDPETNEPVFLFHPRRDGWDDHFRLSDDGYIIPLTPRARATVRLLRINDILRVSERAILIAAGRYL